MAKIWDTEKYVTRASYVPELGSPVVYLLKPLPGERILDLGCGDGALTMKIAESGAVVCGVDLSESMISVARKRGLSADVSDGESLLFRNEFDAVFSNAALHWMKQYQAVISGVHKALKANGRFVGEFGGQGNVTTIIDAIQEVFNDHDTFGEFIDPWFFPSPKNYQAALEKGGFKVKFIKLIDRPTPLKTGIQDWLKIFADGITQELNEAQKRIFFEEMELLLKPKLYTEQDGWVADYVRLRFEALKV